jgi:hypothetical protein
MSFQAGPDLGVALVVFSIFSGLARSQSRFVLEKESGRQVFFQDETTVFQRAWQGRALLGVEHDRSDAPVIFRRDREGETERTDFTFAGWNDSSYWCCRRRQAGGIRCADLA